MGKSTLLHKNFKVLEYLTKGDATLEQLAKAAKARTGNLNLDLLTEQGLVKEENGLYSLGERANFVREMVALSQEWTSSHNDSYLEIAKDTARIIFQYSWKENDIQDIMLYGSTLHSDNPSDIDMLIIHNSRMKRLANATPYGGLLNVDAPYGGENLRKTPHDLVCLLGYKEHPSESPMIQIPQRIIHLGLSDVTEEAIEKKKEEIKGYTWIDGDSIRSHVEWDLDIGGINNLFDLICLHQDTLLVDSDPQKNIWYESAREHAVEVCRDPTFWHRILSEGMLYDKETHEFSLPAIQKYGEGINKLPQGKATTPFHRK